jgi:hypothetical protein
MLYFGLSQHHRIPLNTQTYSPADFDTTQFFIAANGSTAGFSDTAILAHEIDAWMNAPWTGTAIPSVTIPNGFTYHLQKLAFFSWFFGAPSIGVNGWFSDNGAFVTDAGPPCH